MFTIGVENGHFYPKREGPTLKPSSPRLGTCQDQILVPWPTELFSKTLSWDLVGILSSRD